MPLWLSAVLIVLALLACPATMWVMSKVTRRKVSCAMCLPGAAVKGPVGMRDLETRRFEVEREISQVKEEQRLAALRLNNGVEGLPLHAQDAHDEVLRNN